MSPWFAGLSSGCAQVVVASLYHVALTVALEVVYALVDFRSAKQVNFGVGFAFNLFYALSTNYAYYLKEQKGEQGWNPFKGMRW